MRVLLVLGPVQRERDLSQTRELDRTTLLTCLVMSCWDMATTVAHRWFQARGFCFCFLPWPPSSRLAFGFALYCKSSGLIELGRVRLGLDLACACACAQVRGFLSSPPSLLSSLLSSPIPHPLWLVVLGITHLVSFLFLVFFFLLAILFRFSLLPYFAFSFLSSPPLPAEPDSSGQVRPVWNVSCVACIGFLRRLIP